MDTYHIDTLAALYAAIRAAGNNWGKPVRRILHLLLRKKMLQTMYVEANPPSADLDDESNVYSSVVREQCVRLHFFAARIEELSSIQANAESYCGYCDIRSDGTIARSNITVDAIFKNDTYGYVVCRTTEVLELPYGGKVSVTGFSHIEKNHLGIMCSQAAAANVVHYWNARRPNSFSVSTTVQITEAAGVSRERLRKGDFKGLSYPKVGAFFRGQGFSCFTAVIKRPWEDFTGKVKVALKAPIKSSMSLGKQSYQRLKASFRSQETSSIFIGGKKIDIDEKKAGLTIYAFLESGFPVIAVVKTRNEGLHALTIIGHTFDKNIWLAHADRFYYGEPLANGYYSNLQWVRFFIVQDDNLGPYFFVPRVNLEMDIKVIIVPYPSANVAISPSRAEEAAFDALVDWVEQFDATKLLGTNQTWFSILASHFEPNTNGWVLRPFLRRKDQVAELFSGHEFCPVVADAMDKGPGRVFWIVEISWPNLYCYDTHKAGEVVIDASSGAFTLMHIPGAMMFGDPNQSVVIAKQEDGPRPCFAASVAHR